MITLASSMTLAQVARIVESNKARDVEVYVRIESFRGEPIAFLVREDTSRSWIPRYLRQAD